MSYYTGPDCVLKHKEPRFAAPGLLICAGHRRWLHEALEEILIAAALLPIFLEPGTAEDDGHQVKGKRVDPPAPIRLDVVALTDRRGAYIEADHAVGITPALVLLEAWARVVREERQLAFPETKATIFTEVRLLQAHTDWIASQPWIYDYVKELKDCHKALQSAIGYHDAKPVGRCPIVHQITTIDDNGVETTEPQLCDGPLYQDIHGRLSVQCSSCGEQWGELWGQTELRRLGLIMGDTPGEARLA